MDWQNSYCKNGNTIKSYLHTQGNPGQNFNNIHHRTRKRKNKNKTKNPKPLWEHKRPQENTIYTERIVRCIALPDIKLYNRAQLKELQGTHKNKQNKTKKRSGRDTNVM